MRFLLSKVSFVVSSLVAASLCFATQAPILVHAGGDTIEDRLSGEKWLPDTGSSGGTTYTTSHSISHTLLQGLYQSERWHGGSLSYNFSVPNGQYSVVLRFAEIWFTKPNQRVFNVWINGVEVRQNFDIVSAAGQPYTAYDLAFPVTVTGGKVSVNLTSVIESPKISALEIVPVGTSSNNAYLSPGADIQSYVDSYPNETTFHLSPGTYWNQRVFPKTGDTFIGTAGTTILNGGRTLTGFTLRSGLWHVGGQTQQGQVLGVCDPTHFACMYPEDLFFNGTPLTRVASASAVTSGKWYFDYGANDIMFADNPSGKLVQTSITQSAFAGAVSNVTIQNLKVEMYANPAQFGAIGDQYPGPAWVVKSNEVLLNHGPAVRAGSGSNILSNYLHNNGSQGVGGAYASNILVQGNEVASNNYAGYKHAFECGGGKFASINGLTVDRNKIHDNIGPGIWTDTDNFNIVFSNNNIYNNLDNGIQHERSFNAKIFGNTLRNNGVNAFSWLWGSQILIQNSQGVETYNNTVNVPGSFGNGIGLISQNRGSGQYGDYLLKNNYVHNNDVTYQTGSHLGASGVVADYNQSIAFNETSNHFDSNTYHLVNPSSSKNWQYSGLQTWAGFKGHQQEINGNVDSNLKP